MESFSFESQFKGAIRKRYKHAAVQIDSVFLVTDLPAERAEVVRSTAASFLAGVGAVRDAQWRVFTSETLPEVPDLLEIIERDDPGLVVTYRNVKERPRHPRSSLGNYVDSVTQAAQAPVLVLPVRRRSDPDGQQLRSRLTDTSRVIVVTDHLTDDPPLIRYGAEFTSPGGLLILTHIEHQGWFDRYMNAIERIPEIDDDLARECLHNRLLKDASDFIDDAAATLHSGPLDVRVSPIVQMGRPIQAYRDIIGEHDVRLIVGDAKDPSREAMSDLAYSVAVEFTDVPILLL
jgi:hypothetical protein